MTDADRFSRSTLRGAACYSECGQSTGKPSRRISRKSSTPARPRRCRGCSSSSADSSHLKAISLGYSNGRVYAPRSRRRERSPSHRRRSQYCFRRRKYPPRPRPSSLDRSAREGRWPHPTGVDRRTRSGGRVRFPTRKRALGFTDRRYSADLEILTRPGELGIPGSLILLHNRDTGGAVGLAVFRSIRRISGIVATTIWSSSAAGEFSIVSIKSGRSDISGAGGTNRKRQRDQP